MCIYLMRAASSVRKCRSLLNAAYKRRCTVFSFFRSGLRCLLCVTMDTFRWATWCYENLDNIFFRHVRGTDSVHVGLSGRFLDNRRWKMDCFLGVFLSWFIGFFFQYDIFTTDIINNFERIQMAIQESPLKRTFYTFICYQAIVIKTI